MKDKLQRFVRDNREAFETQEPTDELWNRINAQLEQQNPPQKTKPHPKWRAFWGDVNWRIAASIALVISIGWAVYRLNQNYVLGEAPEVVMTSPAYARQVGQYTQLIDDKRAELVKLTENNPELAKEFVTELQQLETSYQNLKADLPKNPNQETVIKAMIQNLQWQIDLLNQQLDIIQRIKNKTTNENHKIM